MIKTLATFLLLAASLPLEAQGADSVQSWTSSDGKIIQAKFVRVEGDAVVIDKDGKSFTIPFAKLAPASVELATRLHANTAGEAEMTEPTLQFRWLQTDPKTAEAIVDAIKANNLPTEAFNAKIDPLIKNGKITEVAAFDRKILSGVRFVLKPANDKVPLMMEAEATLSHDGRLVDLRCVPEWTPKTSKGSGLLRCNTAATLSRRRWQLFARWSDASTDTLLLACGGSNPAESESDTSRGAQLSRASSPPVVVHLDAEWLECSAADLAKVNQAPPESRAKALDWLRGRSTVLASATGTCRSGQKSSQEHLWGGKSHAELRAELDKHPDRDPKEPPSRPGVTFEWEPTIMGRDEPLPTPSLSAPIEEYVSKVNEHILSTDLSLRLNATYVPMNAKAKTPAMEFKFQDKLRPGVPDFVAVKAAPQQSRPVVLVLIPWYEVIR